MSYRSGERLPVEEITRLAHERGALVLLDAYQSAGTLPLDVGALDVDFLAAGTVKYLLGLPGLAFLYARRELVEDQPDGDGLVRGRRRLRDGRPSLRTGASRGALPVGHAARPERVRGARGPAARRGSRRRADRGVDRQLAQAFVDGVERPIVTPASRSAPSASSRRIPWPRSTGSRRTA